MCPLRWTAKSTRHAGRRAARAGVHRCRHCDGGATCCGGWATACRPPPRSSEGAQHPDRDAQFRYINAQARAHLGPGQPVISVDTQEEGAGRRTWPTTGREWQPKGRPTRVDVHDFPDPEVGKAIPYGVYDIGANEGFVVVGDDHDTAAFAVATIGRWWDEVGPVAYPDADPAADHRRRRRLQRLPQPAVEGRARPTWPTAPAWTSPSATPARHLEVEQDRAPPLLRHLHELAGPAPHQPPGRRRPHRRHHHPHRPQGPRPTSTRATTRPASRSPTPNSPPCPSPATTSTATGTTPITPPPQTTTT